MTQAKSWSEVRSYFADNWRQGEHVCLVGPTGSGKTTIARDILPLRRFVCAFAVKRKDETLSALRWPIIRKVRDDTFEAPTRERNERFILWPRIEDESDFQNQHNQFKKAFWDAFGVGAWTIYGDDLGYLSGTLKLDNPIRAIAAQGRSAGLTLVSCIQRPARVPVECYSETGHLFIFRAGDGRDQKRILEIVSAGPIDGREALARSQRLPEHSFLYIDVHKGVMTESNLEPFEAREHISA